MNKAKDILGKALVFETGESVWAVELNRIKEVVKTENIEPLPNSSPKVAGIISVRGEIVPVLSSRWCGERLKSPKRTPRNILLLQSNSEVVGITIEAVQGITEIHAFDLRGQTATQDLGADLISCNALVSTGASVPLLDVRLMVEYLKSGETHEQPSPSLEEIGAQA